MSDLRINISFSNDTAQRVTATGKRKMKNKFRKKRQELQQQRYLGSKHNYHRGQSDYDQTSLHNGGSTKHPTSTQKSLPPAGATTSGSHCSSTRTLPSWAFTQNCTGSHDRAKQSINTKSATTTPALKVNKRLLQPGSSASASHCSSMYSTSTHTLPSLAFTVNSKGSREKPKEPVNTKSSTTTTSGPSASNSHKPITTPGSSASSSHKPSTTSASAAVPTKYLAIDCEMVGTGPKGHISQLARCSIVSYSGDIVYDKFIKPSVPVTDYRTRWSGIRRSDLVNAMPYSQARKEILRLLNGKVVIGHAIHNDFKVLSYSHPAALTRDTSRIPLLNQKAGFAENECASLKRLTKAVFNHDIQTGKKGHSSVEDARATMELYKVVEEEWERRLAPNTRPVSE